MHKVENIEMLINVTREFAKERHVSVETLFDSVEKQVDEIQVFINE